MPGCLRNWKNFKKTKCIERKHQISTSISTKATTKYQCGSCKIKFDEEHYLKKHKQLICKNIDNEKESIGYLKCKFCLKNFNNSIYFLLHEKKCCRIQQGKNPFYGNLNYIL